MILTVVLWGALLGMCLVVALASLALLCCLIAIIADILLPDDPLGEPWERTLAPSMNDQLAEIRHLPVVRR